MTLQRGRGKLRPATSRPDELPNGVPAPEADRSSPVPRQRNGRIIASEAARELGRKGGKRSGLARAQKDPKRWGARLGLGTLLSDPLLGEEKRFRPFLDDAERWYRAKVEELSSTIGGGVASAGVCSIIRTAAMERAFSAYLFEMAMTKAFAFARGSQAEGKTGAKFDVRVDLAQVASKLGDSSRQNLLAAHELCAREAMARKSAPASTSNALAERVEVLIAAEQANAQRWKSQLEAKSASTTVEAPSATEHRGTVADPPSAPTEQLRSGPVRSDPPAATSASVAAPRTSPAPSTPALGTSAPGNVQARHGGAPTPAPPIRMSDEEKLRALCREWLLNSPRKTIEQAKRCNELQTEAERIVSRRWVQDEQSERRWERQQCRGRLQTRPLHVPWPASKWWREHRDGSEADHSVRKYGWILDPEPEKK